MPDPIPFPLPKPEPEPEAPTIPSRVFLSDSITSNMGAFAYPNVNLPLGSSIIVIEHKGDNVFPLERRLVAGGEIPKYEMTALNWDRFNEDLEGGRIASFTVQGAIADVFMGPWRPMQEAPKDGTRIVAVSSDGAAPYFEADGSTLTDYGYLAEFHTHVDDGPCMIEWRDAEPEADEPAGWFVCDTEFDVVANPICWMPIPAASRH